MYKYFGNFVSSCFVRFTFVGSAGTYVYCLIAVRWPRDALKSKSGQKHRLIKTVRSAYYVQTTSTLGLGLVLDI